jgi:virulence factor
VNGAALRIGVIGLGDIATKAYLPVLARRTDLELSLMSRDPERVARVARAFGIARSTTRLDELIAGGLDAAFVHAATDAHAQLVEALLGAGIPVLVDKPLAADLPTAQRLVELAERAGCSLAVGFNRRFAPPYAGLPELPRAAVVVQKNRVGLPDVARRLVFDDFIHVVDTLRFLLPDARPVGVGCAVTDGLLRTVTLTVAAGDSTGVGLMHRVSGSNEEIVEVLGDGYKRRVVDLATVEHSEGGEVRVARRGDWTPVGEQRGFSAMCAHFLDAVREGRVLSARDALRTHALCEDVVAAAEAAGARPAQQQD